MTVYEKYPIVRKLMYLILNEPPVEFDLGQEPSYEEAKYGIQEKHKSILAAVSKQDNEAPTIEEIEKLLERIDLDYAELNSLEKEYAFLMGFSACAELLQEAQTMRDSIR